MFEIDWSDLLTPGGSLAEIVVRGTLVYFVLFAVMRFLPRRTIGEAGASDLLIIVLIADAVQNAMSGEYRSVPEGLLLAGVIIGWALAIDWLDHRFPRLNLSQGKELLLIRDGRFVHENLDRQLITEEEVMSHLRRQGIDSARHVRKAFIEGDGQFTFMLRGGVPARSPQ